MRNLKEAVSSYASQILGCEQFIKNNENNKSRCETSKNSKLTKRQKLRTSIFKKKKKIDEMNEKKQKREKFSRTYLWGTSLAIGIIVCTLLGLVVTLPIIMYSVIMCFFTMTNDLIFHQCFIANLGMNIDKLTEEVEKEMSEEEKLESEINRIQVTIDKIALANKLTEEKIDILRNAMNQMEEMINSQLGNNVFQNRQIQNVSNGNNPAISLR
ncbi:MAG: hypothetical protein OSJ70_06750 [Bacilli bacterium]|nr:hypothetical protein [Bacilli bacterium]